MMSPHQKCLNVGSDDMKIEKANEKNLLSAVISTDMAMGIL